MPLLTLGFTHWLRRVYDILMRTFYYIMIIVIVLISCNQKQENKTTTIKQDLLSQWFLANEDSLVIEFRDKVKAEALCNKCDLTGASVPR